MKASPPMTFTTHQALMPTASADMIYAAVSLVVCWA